MKKLLSIILCVFITLIISGCDKMNQINTSSNINSNLPQSSSAPEKTKITVASYNIQCLSYGTQLSLISEEIKSVNPDIIGLQELDSFTSRSGYADQIKDKQDQYG